MSNVNVLDEGSVKVVLFGGGGYVGQTFMQELSRKGIQYFAPSSSMLNLLHMGSVKFVLESMRPSFVINCAGYTGKPNVDACELNKEDTKLGNVNIPFNLAQICDDLNIPWGHVSSGCIYNGYDIEFTEEDEPNFSFDNPPCSFYSGTKAESEKLLMSGGFNCYIWRLRIPFDEIDSPRNYLSKLQNYDTLLSLENSISHKIEFVRACLATWENSSEYGIYNVVNSNPITAEGAVELIRKHLPFNKEVEFMTNVEDFYQKVGAATPRSNCVLDNSKIMSVYKMRDAHEAVEQSLKDWTK